MSTIELLRVQVKADVAFSDVDKLLQEATQQHSVQQDLITMHYGWHVEDATMLTMFFQWKNGKEQPDLISTHLSNILEGPPEVMHVDFEPIQNFAGAVAAPVTEVAIFLHDGGPPPELQQNVEKAV